MLESLVIHWRRLDLHWLWLNGSGQPIEESSGSWVDFTEMLEAERLKEERVAFQTMVLFSSEQVLLKTVEVPPKPTRQIMDAVPFLVEEVLADDVFDCFIAIGQRVGDVLSVAVIEESLISERLAQLNAHGLDPEFIGIDQDLFQEVQGQLTVTDTLAFLNTWSDEKVAIRSDQLKEMLPIFLGQDAGELTIVDFTELETVEDLLKDSLILSEECLAASETPFLAHLFNQPRSQCINLRQGQYAFRSKSGAATARYKRLGLAAVFVFGLQMVLTAGQGFYLNQQATDLEQEAIALYQSVFPKDSNTRDIARRWRSRLSGSGATNQVGLGALMEVVSQRLSGSGLTLDNLNYNASRGDLVLQLSGRQSDQIMALAEGLMGAGFQAEIGTISQENAAVRGSLRIRTGG